MRRRRFLCLSMGFMGGLAGCQTNRSDPPEATDGRPTGTPTTGVEPTSTTPEARLDVAVVTDRYLVRSHEIPADNRAIPPGDITPAADLPDVLGSALEAAREGGYETDDVSDELLAAIDGFRNFGGGYWIEPYVRVDGTVYEFEPSVPVFVARLVEVDGSEADPDRTVAYDDLDALDGPVRDFVRTIAAFTPQVPRDEYRRSIVPDAIRAFLEENDYVDDPSGVARIETERVDPGPPYTITMRELATEDLWGRRVVEAVDVSHELRTFLEAVTGSTRRAPAQPAGRTEYRTDELPDDFADGFTSAGPTGQDPWARVDGTVYRFRVIEFDRSSIPVAVSASNEPVGERAFTVTIEPSTDGLRYDIEGVVEFEGRGALPSVLWVETDDERYLLESEAYETVRWGPAPESAALDRRVRNVVRETLSADDALSATYRVPDGVPAGAHRVWGWFGASWTNADTGRDYPSIDYPFQVEIVVEDA